MKQLFLSLLNVALPAKPYIKDSLGKPVLPVSAQPTGIKQSAIPEGWSDKLNNEWAAAMNFGRQFSRFEVSPLGDKIINRGSLSLERYARGIY